MMIWLNSDGHGTSTSTPSSWSLALHTPYKARPPPPEFSPAKMVTVEEVRRAQRAEGPATVMAIGTATPPNCVDQSTYPDYYFRITNSEHKAELKEKFQRMCDKSMIKKRYMYLTEEILKENPSVCEYMAPSLDARQDMVVVEVPKLGKEAAAKAIKEWGQPKSKITHLVFCTTSGVDMPGADYQLTKLLGLRPSVKRLMMYQQGCFAGGTVLRLAKDLAENNKGARVLVVCSEITAVTFRGPSDTHLDSLVGQALFGDGAAAIIIGADPIPEVEKPLFELVSAAQTILPDSDGAIDGHLREVGLTFHLLKDVPGLISKNIEKSLVEAQEQALGFSSVSTNIRMTVIKLKSGGLWVHAPIAPTKECIQLVKELGAPVEYIVLPTFAYEHKIFVGPFSRKFPKAQIWVAPRQWSWPLNLPLEFFGIFRAKTLKDEDLSTPWADEIEQKVLSSPEVGIGPYVEVAFYHKRSRTLLVTDAVIYVSRQPPSCISKESLLESAKNGLAVKLLSKGKEVPQEPVVDNKMYRQKGWERMVLQILFLGPSNLLEPNASFARMSQKLIVSPIVKTLVFSKVPEKVRDWIDSIARDWRFKRIIPAHFAAPINASRSDFLAAFGFLDDLLGERYVTRPSLSLLFASIMGKAASYFPPDDMRTLSSLDQFLVSVGAVKKTVSGRKR